MIYFTKPHIKFFLILFFCNIIWGCDFKREAQFHGQTMGTTYSIKVVRNFFKNPLYLKEKIDNRLKDLNKSMSTYLKDSEISQFNRLNNKDENFYPSVDFINVITVAYKLFKITDGSWDGTIMPLVNLWGFGPEESKNRVPKDFEINQRLKDVGFQNIQFLKGKILKKAKPNITLDFASIAKGYAVDEIAKIIQKEGFTNFLVEIGGEIYASGVRKDKKLWRIGINRPDKEASSRQVYKAVAIKDRALATSGDYRIFFEISNKRYSHIIDPRNGYPVKNGVVSVSVISDTCIFADGLATALMVLGHKRGLEIINSIKNTQCVIVVREEDGSLTDHYSFNFPVK